MRILGFDYGEKRVGVAVSDEGGAIALPLTTLDRRKNFTGELRKIAEKYGASLIVVGHPLGIDGEEGKMAKKVEKEARRISNILNIECVLWDERFTSRQAENAAEPTRSKKGKKDMVAATLILQSYLDRLRARGAVNAE
ncbi:MAG: Holliday junction resolvase RuvX [bacterium]